MPDIQPDETSSDNEEAIPHRGNITESEPGECSSSVVEIPPPWQEPEGQAKHQEVVKQEKMPELGKVAIKGKAHFEREGTTPKEAKGIRKRESGRRRVPTKRLGIDEVMALEEEDKEIEPYTVWNKK